MQNDEKKSHFLKQINQVFMLTTNVSYITSYMQIILNKKR